MLPRLKGQSLSNFCSSVTSCGRFSLFLSFALYMFPSFPSVSAYMRFSQRTEVFKRLYHAKKGCN